MLLIKAGTPIQRLCSDGGLMTDRKDGEAERAEQQYVIYDEAIILEPQENNGKWFFNMHSGMNWEVEEKYVQDNRRKH